VLELRVGSRTGDGVVVEARIRGPDGRPALAEAVSGTLRRATHARDDRPVIFEPALEGAWRAVVAPPGGGIWEISVQARSAGAVANGSLRL
jgi:nitrogen fixation protein FixH